MKISIVHAQGKEVIEYYISELLEEGIVHIPAWTEAQDGAPELSREDDHGATIKASSTIGSSGLSVVISPSSPVMSRAVSCTSTMNLGASASNIACGDEGVKAVGLFCVNSFLVKLRTSCCPSYGERIVSSTYP